MRPNWPRAIDHALVAGFHADRVAWAFLSGYLAALRQLIPDLPDEPPVAFCVSEENGNHPSAIATRLESSPDGDLRLTGAKQFVTGGTAARTLLVAARNGDRDDGRPSIRVVRIAADSPGLRIEAMPQLPFVPEIPHARLVFENTPVDPDAILPGDGYTAYVRPFRTIEDLHVTAAVGAWLLQVARAHEWPDAAVAELHALLAAMRGLAREDPAAPATHVALGGTLVLFNEWISHNGSEWARVPAGERGAWTRDRQLLGVASRARAARLEAAWKRLSGAPGRS